jgi:GT2 family glycosyltransferase
MTVVAEPHGGAERSGADRSLGDLRALVLTHGVDGGYLPLLESLLEEGLTADRVLLVHNASRPGEPAPDSPLGCEVLSSPRNLGYAIAMNRGIEFQIKRGCELLLVLTHDARFRPGSLKALAEAAVENSAYGVLGPALVRADTGKPFSFGGVIGPDGAVDHVPERPPVSGGVVPCDWIDGGTMLFRTELLERIGGFDEGFWLYAEDADICLRASRAGAAVGLVLDAQAAQAPGGGKRPAAWSYLMARNGAAFAYRARGRRAAALTVARNLREAILNLGRTAARLLRVRQGPPVEPWSLAVGSIRGTFDLLRRRWGPPPHLPGAGDIQNVGG